MPFPAVTGSTVIGALPPGRRSGRRRFGALAIVLALVMVLGLAAPASALPTGVDVASYQHPGGAPIDWNAVRAAGHSYAFIKATESSNYTNPYFASDWQEAGNAGLYRGAYHYARPALPLDTALAQARYFVSRAGSMTGPADLPGVLDLEATGGLGQADLADWVRTWLGEVQRLTGKAPIIYTGYYFWRDSVGNPTDIGANYRLWLPSYPADPNSTTFRPLVSAGWGTWTFWQYTSTGSVPGISGSVDVNRFCCDGPSLVALAGSGGGGGGPFGSLDVVAGGAGRVSVAGWAIDPDTAAPIAVHVYVGAAATGITANGSRPDVGAVFTGFGDQHGFTASIPASPGFQQVCAYGIDVGGSVNNLIGCRTVLVLPNSPIGTVDVARPVIGGIQVAGWAIDPDTSTSIPVHVYVDNTLTGLTADGPRPDVAAAFPGYGPAHGYSRVVPASPGTHTVCAYGINTVAPGGNSQLGCRTVTVPTGPPFGSLDLAGTAYGLVRVAGWSIDPDTSNPTAVHVYVNGVVHGFVANGSRPDVGAAFPGAGNAHGFDVAVPEVGTGPQTVCVYAIDMVAPGYNVPLGCRTL
jgi:GH25 family lysozyme M1 (1,4-beta-N-acetylmuramidase)